MFQPFREVNEFYPGLILWCSARSREIELASLAAGEVYESKKARELKPHMVVDVDYTNQVILVARLCAGTPANPRRWSRIDASPPITWMVPSAWIWVGAPASVGIVLNNTRAMHPHQQAVYSTPPISTANIQSYRIRRQIYQDTNPMSSTVQSPFGGQSGYPSSSSGAYTTLAPQPVVVPTGFTDQHPNYPGWWRNPHTGWFWSPSQGLMPPRT
ncbi:hypothetical protein C8F01DRAFT_1083140 [Mycena amicta]|nr:hypothetical protein C8F01DRAFT_1083140 [Mycena amicta]